MNEEVSRLRALASQVVDRALARGVDVAEAVASSGSDLSTQVRLGEPELVEEAGYRGIGLRVIKEQRVALTATSDLTEAGLDRVLADALELVEISQEDPFAGPADPELVADRVEPPEDLFDPAVSAIRAEDALDWAKRGEAAARSADERITNSDGATFSRTYGARALVLSGGFAAGYATTYASLVVTPVADDRDDKKRRGFHWTARRHLAELDPAEEVGAEAARRTVRMLGAKTVPSCEAPVVFEPDAARSIVGLLASCVMGSAIWRKQSYLCDRENTRVASDLCTLVDDPLLPRAPGSRPFDGEGMPSRRNVVVDQGILKTYLCDSYSARKLDRAPTASAARGGSGGVGPSTTNFVLRPTDLPADQIIQSTSSGLYVTDMMGFGFNAVTGDFSRGASGFWIDDGKLVHPVSEVTISLNVDELFQRIDAIGDDLDTRTATASPTFRVSAMTIAGA
ncbi:MAG: TldD/PmbA family protein [Deltaproteobacteria bacterium]|jgi:PmbA protein|nr:TldD/PmbA family protein [Deltaproteobacteria bacterium]MBW2537024.1 TldD/PmbA family protein [Deltaproteobacteria bacterium]